MKKRFLSLIMILLIGTLIIGACKASPAEVQTPAEGTGEDVVSPVEPAETEGEEVVLRIIHPAFDQNWSPMLGGGHVSRLYSFICCPNVF